MASRATRLALGALTCILAGASGTVMPLGDAGAAEQCVATPKKESPSGQHWYYRIDRSTKRHCWYLGERGKTVSNTAKSTSSRRALFAKLKREAPLPRRDANARAELAPTRVDDTLRVDDASITPPGRNRLVEPQRADREPASRASADNTQSLVASRWPESASARSSVNVPPDDVSAIASAAPAADGDATTEPIPGSSPAAMNKAIAFAASKVEASAVTRTHSLYSLFWALCGAFALVAFAGGATYFMTSAGPRTHNGWSFDARTTWLDPAASMSIRLSSAAHEADEPRRAQLPGGLART
jgi:hypothetical protein